MQGLLRESPRPVLAHAGEALRQRKSVLPLRHVRPVLYEQKEFTETHRDGPLIDNSKPNDI